MNDCKNRQINDWRVIIDMSCDTPNSIMSFSFNDSNIYELILTERTVSLHTTPFQMN